jgi:hypothetical protein
MLRALLFAMTILALPLGSASAETGPDLEANAALKYWQAFAQLPKFTDAEQTKLLAECLTMPLDAHAREIVTKAEYALRMMHRGAALPRCAWGIGYEDGIDVLIPHAQASRVLSSIACLHARLRFDEGQNAEAIEDIVSSMTLGRHVSLDGTLISVLVGYSIENRTSEALALYLPRLNAGTIKGLKTRLDALPPFGTPATALLTCEKETMNWFVRKVKEAKDKERLLVFLSALCGKGDDSAEKSRERGLAFLEACSGNADGVVKFAEETRGSYELMAKKLDLPVDPFEKEWDREQMKQAGNPVFKLLFPNVHKVRLAQARADIRRALLSAALAVRLDGPEALKNHPDPVVGGPFEQVAFEGGFELRSKWKLGEKVRSKWKLDEGFDKPLVLTVGLRGK